LTPAVPYAWQKIGEYILLPCAASPRLNVLGFLNRQNQITPFVYPDTVTADVVIACMDHFAKSITKTSYVVIDNAPMHTSAKFQNRIAVWKEKGLIIKQIPRYSPELNLIEILWRKIKYEWLPFGAYLNFETLTRELEYVLCEIGQKYQIIFA
jgi:transposase